MNTRCPYCGAPAEWSSSTNQETGNVWQDNKAWCTLKASCGWEGFVYELWDGE